MTRSDMGCSGECGSGAGQFFGRKETAVVVVRGAGAFARNHGGAEWMARRALLAEGRALGRLDGSAQHIAGAAEWRLLGVNAGDVEALFGVELAIGSLSRQPLFGITPMPRQARSVTSKTSESSFCAGKLPSKVTTRS